MSEQPGLFGPIPPDPPYGGHAPYHRDPQPTELDAALGIDPELDSLEWMVFCWVKAAGPTGITSKEASRRYAERKGCTADVARNTMAPRLTTLVEKGYAQYDQEHRRERCQPAVWTGLDYVKS